MFLTSLVVLGLIALYIVLRLYVLLRIKRKMTPEDKKSQEEWSRYCIPHVGDYQITIEYVDGTGKVVGGWSPCTFFGTIEEAQVHGVRLLAEKGVWGERGVGRAKITRYETCPTCGNGYHKEICIE